MEMLPEYPVQLPEHILEAPIDVAQWNQRVALSSAGRQLVYLSILLLGILAFLALKFLRHSKAKSPNRLGSSHITWNICGIATATGCAVITALSLTGGSYCQFLLIILPSILWGIVVALRFLYFILPSYRPLFYLSANLISLAVFASTITPKYILPFVITDTRHYSSDPKSLALIFAAVTSALIIPLFTPYHLDTANDAPLHPRVFSSPITRWWTYSWITPFITKSYRLKSNLSVDDLPPLTPHSSPSKWLSDFDSIRPASKSTSAALFKLFYSRMTTMAVMMVFCGLSEFIGAIGLRNLLLHLESRASAAIFTPWFSVFLFGLSPVLRGFFMQTFEFFSTDAICHLKGMIVSRIYEQILASRPGVKLDAGQVTNLVSADIDKLSTLKYTIMAGFMVPVEVFVASILLYQSLGWSCLPGLAILLLTRAPIAWYFSKFQGVAQGRVMSAIDARVRRVSDTIKGLQFVKMLGQGVSFVTWIGEKREAELHMIWRKWILVALSDSVSSLFVLVPLVLSLAMYTLVAKMPLQPSVVFTVLSVFNTLQKMLSLTVIGASTYAQSMVSLGRLSAFLDEPTAATLEGLDINLFEASSPHSIFGSRDATLHVQNHDGPAEAVIKNATIDIVRGGLNLVVGKTGSGKSSLVKGLISELPLSSGHCSLRDHPCEPLSYASQAPWLQRGTVRENIIFSSSFCAKRYDSVLRATTLDIDLKSLPVGDLSDVGEGGSSLSGGQRARVALARAIYASTKTVILDDVLSALDANTAAFILENVIDGPLLKGRTVILVSENSKCRNIANQIIELDNGEVKSVTKQTKESLSKVPDITISQHELESSETLNIVEAESMTVSPSPSDLESLHKEDGEPPKSSLNPEVIRTDRIGRLAMFKYMGLFGKAPMLVSLCLVILAAQGADVASSFWLTIWSSRTETPGNSDLFYVSTYLGIGLSWISLATAGTLLLFAGTIRAGQTLHSKMLTSVLGSTFAFVTSTPAGQLMNRFSSDMFSLDNSLPELIKQVIENYLSIVFRVAAVSSVLPIFLVPAILFLGMGVMTGQVYMYGSTASKRLYAAGLSPILTSISETISGIEVIRAYRVQDSLRNTFMQSLEVYLRGWETVSASQRWLAVRMDFFAGMISFSTAALSMLLAKNNPAKVGFSMTSSSALCTALLYAVYLASVLEVEMNSFQRVEQYISEIPQEEDAYSEDQEEGISSAWPWQGNLQVSNLSAGYSLDGESVLKKISFGVKPGKRIAIVGRSGSGKSSLVASILRLVVKHQGSVTIDGVDVGHVGVQRLRQSISFIPQDPTLFEGSLRFNLDFTGTIPDSTLEAVLARVVSNRVDVSNVWSLDRHIASNGSNLSQGERQLVAMARALANNSRIVIIDEATASLDPESDHRIQRLLRERFSQKAIVAIAHRLNTIVDFDEVLVLDSGEIVERGCPQALIESGEGRFWEMWVASAGSGDVGKDKGGSS